MINCAYSVIPILLNIQTGLQAIHNSRLIEMVLRNLSKPKFSEPEDFICLIIRTTFIKLLGILF